MTVRQLAGTTAVVTGASRGFGRAITFSLVERGARVVGVARSQELLTELEEQLGDAFVPEVADVADPAVAKQVIADYRPQTVVLNAGRPLRWDRFRNKPGRRSAPTGMWMSDTSSTSHKRF